MEFMKVGSSKPSIGSTCVLAFSSDDGIMVDNYNHYSYLKFSYITDLEDVSLEDDDVDYEGFTILKRTYHGPKPFVWKKVTNAVAYLELPMFLKEEELNG